MQLWMLTLLLLGGGNPAVVKNPSRVLAEPKFWARRVGELNRGQSVTLLESMGTWYRVRLANQQVGYVPRSAFANAVAVPAAHFEGAAPQASETQAANASRGFSKEAHAADIGKPGLKKADELLAAYVAGPAAAGLDAALAKDMAGFIKKGKLGGGQP